MSRLTTYSHDGLTFDVVDAGPADGPVVVLLHGFPQRASSWDAVAELLHGQGFRTIAPDQRGYSPRARPRGRAAYRSTKLMGDVAALVDAIGAGPVHLVGHDWGAVVAWALTANRPDLVRSLTAVSVPHPAAFLRALTSSNQALKSWYMGVFQLPFLPELLARKRPEAFVRLLRNTGMTEQDLRQFRTGILEYGALPGALGWYRALPLTSPGEVGTPVRVPTTLVWSTGDSALGRRGTDLCERYVRAPYELVVLDGVSHWVPEHAPGPLADAIVARIASPV